MLLKFMLAFFNVLGTFSSVCLLIANIFPQSLYRLKRYVGVNNLSAIKFVVCRKCVSIYHYKNCISGCSSKTRSCIKFPNHRYRIHRQQCGTLLLKSVELSTGRKILYPYLTYCYLGLQWAMQQFLLNPDFVTLSEQCRLRESHDNVLCDIYDGKIWSDFQTVHGQSLNFLSEPLTFGMMINVDWFLP